MTTGPFLEHARKIFDYLISTRDPSEYKLFSYVCDALRWSVPFDYPRDSLDLTEKSDQYAQQHEHYISSPHSPISISPGTDWVYYEFNKKFSSQLHPSTIRYDTVFATSHVEPLKVVYKCYFSLFLPISEPDLEARLFQHADTCTTAAKKIMERLYDDIQKHRSRLVISGLKVPATPYDFVSFADNLVIYYSDQTLGKQIYQIAAAEIDKCSLPIFERRLRGNYGFDLKPKSGKFSVTFTELVAAYVGLKLVPHASTQLSYPSFVGQFMDYIAAASSKSPSELADFFHIVRKGNIQPKTKTPIQFDIKALQVHIRRIADQKLQ